MRAFTRVVPKKLVLVVEHELADRAIITSMLSTGGYDYREALNGADALRVLDSGEKVDLMTSAVMMPGMDGLSLLAQVNESHPGLPLIFLTAVHDRAVADAAIRAGARDYLLKPFDRDRLLVAVDNILGVNRDSPDLDQLLREGSSPERSFRWYWIGYWICWVLTFIATWIYCIATYGFLLGVGLGWLPSAITASVVSLAWPLLVVGVAVSAYVLSR